MRLFKTVAGLQTYLKSQQALKTTGLVPTMGALHAGHASLIRQAVDETDTVVVSIFVNPLQFAPSEDLQRYPRPLAQDCQLCEQLGVEVVFAPTAEEMGILPESDAASCLMTQVIPPPLMSDRLCGEFRLGHFRGVATIVSKLFNVVKPHLAYFGEKDAQQLAIIRRVVADLNLPVQIKSCPTLREASGLAYSSRNQYLSPTERSQALALCRSLRQAQQAFKQGQRNAQQLLDLVRRELAQTPEVKLQYVELVDPDTLVALETVEEAGLLAIAAYVGSIRLIDNVILRQRQPIIAIDGPAGAGKSTVTRRVASTLNLLYVDTGAMYRAIAWLVWQAQIPVTDEAAIAELVSQATLEYILTPNTLLARLKINGKDVTEAIRTPEVTALVSAVSAQVVVRQKLVQYQHQLGKKGAIVIEGRDIGTNVFPDAELKIFLTASVQERAKRRWQEFQAQGNTDIFLEQLEKEIQQRDDFDSNRSLAPLRKAVDAITINTDGLSIEEVTDKIVQLYQQTVDRQRFMTDDQ